MATREKTRDELDMQTLRELASLPANKFCFDCGQRGTTYVNVTIGAFVCSSCGGLLRGLNPPHRVKSLTVCSFTEVEMDRIKSRGNEYCTHIWLGKYDSNLSEVDFSSPEKRKEFMIQKYEEKKFYVDPREAIKKMKPRAPAVPTSTTPNSVTRSQTVVPNRKPPQLQKSGAVSQTFSAGDISSNTIPNLFENDPFKEVKQGDSTTDGASFADFSSAFGNAGSKAASSSGQTTATTTSSSSTAPASQSHKKPAPPPPDRYAALADLDNQLHQQVAPDITAPIPSVIVASTNTTAFWSSVTPAIPGAIYPPGTQNPFSNTAPTWSQPIACTPNPFQAVTQPIPVSNKTAAPQQNSNGMPNTAKPSLQNGAISNTYWPSASNQAWSGQYQNRQPDPFLVNNSTAADSYNPWAQSYASSGANPFVNNTFAPGQPSSTPRTNTNVTRNPFL